MTTVAILPIYDDSGNKSYRAIAGDKHSTGKTAGQALDALTAELGENEFSALLLLQSFCPGSIFRCTTTFSFIRTDGYVENCTFSRAIRSHPKYKLN